MPKSAKPKKSARVRDDALAHLYTDGSHKKGTLERGYGACLVFCKRIYKLSGVADPRVDSDAVSNPTMELRAAAIGLERLRQVRPPSLLSVDVIADYIGVIRYGEGKWKPASAKISHFRDEAHRLVRAAQALRDENVGVQFTHVRGHSGVKGNEMADALARSGITQDTFSKLVTKLSN